ncbi:unnamed protein product [Sphagnum jensenii]
MLMPLTLTRRSDGPPGGHANLGRGLPRLEENSLEGVLAVEVIATSLRPKVVNQEAPEDVKGLAAVSESARVIAVEVRGVVVLFEDGSPRRMKGQPGEGPHFAWPGVVPYSGNDLGDRRVSKVEGLDEGDDAGGMLLPLRITVPPLSRVTKEGSVPYVARLLPMPVTWVPFELGDEAGLEDLVDWWFFSRGGNILG